MLDAPLPLSCQQQARACGSALSSLPSRGHSWGLRVFSLIIPFPLAWSWEDAVLTDSEVSLSLTVR